MRVDNWAEVYRVLWRTKDPLVLDDFDLAVQEAGAFKAAGGATVVDVTSKGLGRDPERLMKTLDILEGEGADLGRVIVDHIGGDAPEQMDILAAALARGVTLEFDLLGVAFLLEEKVSDTRGAADTIAALAKKGYADQLLLSQDVCTKTQLKAYGGNGYDYVLSDVVPCLKAVGVIDADVEKLLVANPARLFSIAP